MARPIAATPVLDGEDAERFVEYINSEPTPEEIVHAKKWKKIIDDYNKAHGYKYMHCDD